MLTRESGHFGIELEFEDWRVSKETIIGHISRNDLRGVFTQFEDGRVAFTLSDPKGEVFSLRSQKVHIDNPGAVLLLASWNPTEKFIAANGIILLAADQTEDTAIIPASPRSRLQNGPISFEQPDCKDACRPWMEWRAANLGTPPAKVEQGRRPKTFLEQAAELERSQLLLHDLIARAESGANHVVGAIATELRALIFWPRRPSRNYDPLLLRLAARRNAPLPVWAFIARGCADKDLEDLGKLAHSFGFLDTGPDIRKRHKGQKLVDLQAWLDDPFQLNADGEGTREFGKICLTHGEIIKQVASILGTSHYDEDVPVELDAFRNLFSESGGEMARMLVQVAKSVHDLISYFRLEYCKG